MDTELEQAKQKMKQALDHFKSELKKIRTGRANPQMLEGVMVEVYGQKMPLEHIANINTVDAQLLQITPYDPGTLNEISAVIRNDASLGLNPADDGKVVRVPVPPLTTERRELIVKQVYEKAEDSRISLRNARHDVLNTAKQKQKDNEINEDEYHRTEKQADELITEYQKSIDEHSKAKEQELMTV